MTALVWMNFPLCALVFLAIAGIPLWLVLTRREWGPGHASPDERVSPVPVPVSDAAVTGEQPAATAGRPLAGVRG